MMDSNFLSSADFDTLHEFFGVLPRLMIQGWHDDTELDLGFFTSLTELEVRTVVNFKLFCFSYTFTPAVFTYVLLLFSPRYAIVT